MGGPLTRERRPLGKGAAPKIASSDSSDTGTAEPTGRVRQDAATRWLAEELAAVVELLHAARLSAKAGHVPGVHLRRAAVRLVALDAAVADDLALVRTMRADDDEQVPA